MKISLLSFGGPAGQIAVMHRVLVDEKKWISESRFLHALNFCMLLPGPEAQQLATYIGWLLHRTIGGLTAGILFVLPGFISILVLSVLYAAYQNTSAVQAIFFGLKPAVLAVVIEAVWRIGRRVLKRPTMYVLAVAAFVAIFFFDVPFPFIILAAALIGFLLGTLPAKRFDVSPAILDSDEQLTGIAAVSDADGSTRPSVIRSVRVLVICLMLWFIPLILIRLIAGPTSVYLQEGIFFSKVAVVTFGGAYAVLAYVAQEAVNTYQWLQPWARLDGLGMAETTPGPLIMVVQFVGFIGAFRSPGDLNPMLAGVFASLLVTWVTFVPCFLWIFLGAPYIERLREKKALGSALTAITAAVVGVVLNLAVWFALHSLFGMVDEIRSFGARVYVPAWMTLDLGALVILFLALFAIFRLKIGMIATLLVCTGIGAAYHVLWR